MDDTFDMGIEEEPLAERLVSTLPMSGKGFLNGGLLLSVVLASGGGYLLATTAGKGESATLVAAALCLIFGSVGLIFFLALLFNRWLMLRRLRAMLNGERLAYWRYSEADWSPYVEHQWMKAAEQWPFTSANLGAGAILGGIFAAVAIFVGWNLPFPLIATVAVGFAIGFLFFLIIQALTWVAWQRWCASLVGRPGEAYIGRDSAYFHSRMLVWNCLGCTLTRAVYLDDAGPPRLEITVHVSSGKSSADHELAIPVPAGQESHGRLVAAQLLGGDPG